MELAERRVDAALLTLATLGSGALSLSLGQDLNFDQIHYHYYLGWSLVAGRLGQDIAPAGIGTYLNPVLHLPTYFGITYLPPRAFGFLLGAIHGLNAFFAYRLVARLLEGQRWRLGLAAAAGLVAALGPCAVGLLGTTFGDNLASLPALAALLLLVDTAGRDGSAPVSGPRMAAVGVLGGLATGVKLTMAVFHVALAAAVAVFALRKRSLRLPLAFALGSLLGGLASGGYWAHQVWQRFRNPVFPFANSVFRSPDYAPVNFKDDVWRARGLQDLWIAPAEMAAGATERFQPVPFRDPRYLVLLAVAAGVAANGLLRSRLARPSGSLASCLVLVYWFTAYAVWSWLFFYYRYFATGEFVAPVAIVAALTLLARPRRIAPAWLALASVIAVGSTTGNWGRIPWSDSWFRVRLPKMAEAPDAAVFVDAACVSYVLPSFPHTARFLGVRQLPRLRPVVARELWAHQGPILRLTRADQRPSDLTLYSLKDTGDCEVVRTRRFRLDLCRLARVGLSGPSP